MYHPRFKTCYAKIHQLLLSIFLVCLPALAWSHNLNFGSLTLQTDTKNPEHVSLVFQMSDDQGRHLRARVGIPEDCVEQFHTVELYNITQMRYRQDLSCPNKTLTDLTFSLKAIPPGAKVMITVRQDGNLIDEQVLAPEQTTWQASENPEPPSGASTFTKFLSLGFIHILLGWDHLLFVWMLVLLVQTPRHLFWTITAFTVGHSLTLGLAAVSVITVPIPPTEALIALSILFLAAEIIRFDRSAQKTVTLKYPGIISACFGLFHGLGFSSVLQEFQTDDSPILWQLSGFNVGVELGQLVFVFALLAAGYQLRKHLPIADASAQKTQHASQPTSSRSAPMRHLLSRTTIATLCGSVAAFALIERVAGF